MNTNIKFDFSYKTDQQECLLVEGIPSTQHLDHKNIYNRWKIDFDMNLIFCNLGLDPQMTLIYYVNFSRIQAWKSKVRLDICHLMTTMVKIHVYSQHKVLCFSGSKILTWINRQTELTETSEYADGNYVVQLMSKISISELQSLAWKSPRKAICQKDIYVLTFRFISKLIWMGLKYSVMWWCSDVLVITSIRGLRIRPLGHCDSILLLPTLKLGLSL